MISIHLLFLLMQGTGFVLKRGLRAILRQHKEHRRNKSSQAVVETETEEHAR